MDDNEVQFEGTESVDERIKRKHAEALKTGAVVDLAAMEEDEENTRRKKPRQHVSNQQRQGAVLTNNNGRSPASSSPPLRVKRGPPREPNRDDADEQDNSDPTMAQIVQQLKPWQRDDATPTQIVDALESGNQEDTISILDTIRDKTMQSDDSRRELASAGAIGTIVFAMQKYSSQPLVQEMACLTLFSLAFDNVENQNQIVLSRGVVFIVRAMSNHRHSANVQEMACAALVALIYVEEARRSLYDSGGIALVLKGARNFRHLVSVQKTTCEILASLAGDKNPYYLAAITDSGGIMDVVEAMASHPGSRATQDWGCRALASLCRDNKGAASVIAQAGGITTLLNALRRDVRWFDVHISASSALRNLSAVDAIKKTIIQQGGIEIIEQCMAAHRGLDYVQKACQDAIDALTGSPETTCCARLFGLEDVVSDLISKFSFNKL